MQERTFDRRRFLKTAAAAALCAPLARAAARPPNVVLIYADDLGYGDLGCYGSPLRTPHLDRLAADGARFTHFYSANPVCSPARAALMTGRYPTRVGVPRVLNPRDTTGLPDSETTMAQVLKAKGYRTMCIGKWHLGHLPQYLPTSRGFDQYFGIPYSNDMNPRVLMRNTEVIEETATLETLTPRYTEQALGFLERSRKDPFFLYMPHTYPHIPLAASERFRGKSAAGLYGDVVEELDWSVGQVLDALKKHNLESNTLVLFSSDNGPWFLGSPGRLRGRKGSTYEGGVRVPFLARWPGRIPKGRVCAGVGSIMDLLPTIARLCDAPLPKNPLVPFQLAKQSSRETLPLAKLSSPAPGSLPEKVGTALDGVDIWPLLSGEKQELEREALLHFDNVNVQCARWRNWKLHIARYNSMAYNPAPAAGRVNLPLPAAELYDLVKDPDESYDLAPERPQVVAEIRGRIERLLENFPEDVRRAYAETKSRATAASAVGALPRPAPK